MYSLYRILNSKSDNIYIGMTKVSLGRRFSQHKYSAKSGKKSKLYDAMRSYGLDSFSIELLETFNTKEECCNREILLIAQQDNLYNLASGGEGGFNISNIKDWKAKLSKAREGGKPFQGRKHSEETKRLCSEAALRYHASKRAESNVFG